MNEQMRSQNPLMAVCAGAPFQQPRLGQSKLPRNGICCCVAPAVVQLPSGAEMADLPNVNVQSRPDTSNDRVTGGFWQMDGCLGQPRKTKALGETNNPQHKRAS
jgi:hypothetical protein